MIDGHKQIPPDSSDLDPFFIDRHSAGEEPRALLHDALPVDVGQRAEPAHHRGLVDTEKTPDALQAQPMIREDEGQQHRPCGPFPELSQLGWRDLTLEQRVLSGRHGRVGWGRHGLLLCTRGR